MSFIQGEFQLWRFHTKLVVMAMFLEKSQNAGFKSGSISKTVLVRDTITTGC